MSHDYNYRANGTVLTTTTGVRDVRLMEGVAGKRAEMIDIAYQHGVYVAPRHWSQARMMFLDIIIPLSGTATQIYTVKHDLEGLLLNGLVTLTRNDPEAGDVETEILVSDPVNQPEGAQRFQWRWPVWQLKGYWQEVTASHSVTNATLGATANLTTVNVGGTHPTEPVFTVTCQSAGSNPAVTDPATGDAIVLAASFATSDVVIVDVPERKAYLNGTRVKNLVTINRGHWMEFAAGATVDLDFTSDSGSWDVQTVVKNRFRG
jgi:hypothetical protein